jgi:hypothetical protein
VGRDGQSAMEKITDNCFSKTSEKEDKTAVEYNTMKPTNNLNDKIGF